LTLVHEKNVDTKTIFLLIFGIVFIAFLFTSDGHRYSIDEYLGEEMALRMITLEPHPDYIDGESTNFFDIPVMNPTKSGPICSNGITCYPISIFYSITEIPFIAINHYFHIITSDTLIFTTGDFIDPHYVFWRNSENVNLVFMELFYGPFFSAFSVAVFFLICREHKFSRQNSVLLTFLLAFSTLIWAYSNTSLNALPSSFFILLGYLFYKKFQRLNQQKFLVFSSASFGFSFLIRPDTILFVIPIWIFLLVSVLNRNAKIHSLLFFSLPLLFSYFTKRLIPLLRYESSSDTVGVPLGGEIKAFSALLSTNLSETFTGVFGLLFAPGVGLFIFSPILLTIFFSFPDFFRKNKSECILFLSFFTLTLLYHGYLNHWHGLVAWGPRYLLPLIPFLLIPLGASLEKRKKQLMLLIIIPLSLLGIFFNLSYVIQDVGWFVWSTPGTHVGLFGLGTGAANHDLWINNIIIWTFQYSQLTHSISLLFEGLQHDLYLLHLFGPTVYFSILIPSIIFLIYLLWRTGVIISKNDYFSFHKMINSLLKR